MKRYWKSLRFHKGQIVSARADFFKKSHGWIVKHTKDMECP